MGIESPGSAAANSAPPVRRDLFISYSAADVETAHAIRVVLETSGYSTWMAPDDVGGAVPWAEQIADAAAGCRAMLVLVSAASMSSRHVPKEAELAVAKAKPLIPVRLQEVIPRGSLEYLLSLTQWVDIFPGPLEAHAENLLAHVSRTLAAADPPPPAASSTAAARPTPTVTPPPLVRPRSGARKLRKALFALAALATILISILSFTQANAAGILQARALAVSPNPTEAGTTVTVSGRDWATGAPVEIQWGAAYGPVAATGVSNASGGFAISFVVPRATAPGTYEIWACQYAAGTDCSPSNEFKSMESTTLTVVDTDTPPQANPDRFVTAMGQPVAIPDETLTANDTDPDGDPLCITVQLVDAPGNGALVRITDLIWAYTPNWGFFGTDTFTYRVCDQVNGAWSNVTTVSIDVVFDGSVAASPGSGQAGTRVTVRGSDFVADADVEVRWEGSRVAVAMADGEGSFTVDFVVSDVAPGRYDITACTLDTAACAGTSFEVTSPPTPTTTTPTTTTTAAPTTTTSVDTTEPASVTEGPAAADDEAVVELGVPTVIDVLANDSHPDGPLDVATLEIVRPAQFGSAEITGRGTVTYVAHDEFTGTDRFRYRICDTTRRCTRAVVTIRLAHRTACGADAVVVESFTVTPADVTPGAAVRVELRVDEERLADCIPPPVQFFWSDAAWGGAVGLTGGVVAVDRVVPEAAEAGSHPIFARDADTDVALAGTLLAVTALPAPPPAPEPTPAPESGRWWPLIPLGVAALGAGAWIGARRWGGASRRLVRLRATADAAKVRAMDLGRQASTLDAELAECEAQHGGGIAVLPTGAWVGESAGGTSPYLLDNENPHAPPQEDGHRGWYYPRRKEPIRGIILHTTEGMALSGTSADHVARYFATCRRPGSAHAVVDAGGAITLLPDNYTAMHVPAANSASLGLIVCLEDDPEQQSAAYAHVARWCRVKAAEHDFPFERIDPGDWRLGAMGVLGHSDLDPDAPDPAAPGGAPFEWAALVEADAGPSKFPGAVPMRRPGADPCAELRARAQQAREAASQAAVEAADAVQAAADAGR